MKEWAMADPLDHVVLTNVSAPPRAGDPPMDPERVWYLLGLFLDACLPSVRAQGVPHTWLVWFDDRADPDLVAEVERIAEGVFTPLWREAFDATSAADNVGRHSTAPWVATTWVACDHGLARDGLATVAACHDGRGPVSVSFPHGLTIDRNGNAFESHDESGPVRSLVAQRTPGRPIATVVGGLPEGVDDLREVVVADRPMWIDVNHEPAGAEPPHGRRVDARTVAERFAIDLAHDQVPAAGGAGKRPGGDPAVGSFADKVLRGVRWLRGERDEPSGG